MGTGIDANNFRAAFFGFDGPFKATGVLFSGVAAANHNHVGVFHIRPVIGHCAATKGGPQTGDSGAVSYPGLVFQVDNAQGARQFGNQVALFIVHTGRA